MPPIPKMPIPARIAVFGAAGRMGSSLADYLRFASPGTTLRLLSSSADNLAALRTHYPGSETTLANYLDSASLTSALQDVESIFVVTPSGLDEEAAMTNLVNAVRRAGTVRHIVRVLGHEPEATLARVPARLALRKGDGTQHFIARAILDRAALPVTFLNCGATMMDNFRWFRKPISERNLLVYPPRDVPFIDVRDFAEIAARLLISGDARHIGQFHTANNGCDQLTSPEVAALFSDVLRRDIRYDGSREGFFREYGAFLDARQPGEAQYRWDFIQFELENSVVWALNNFAERILKRRPTTLRSWIMEHRAAFSASSRV